MRAHGTEAPGSCGLLLEKRPGRFSCAACNQPLFASKEKFEADGARGIVGELALAGGQTRAQLRHRHYGAERIVRRAA